MELTNAEMTSVMAAEGFARDAQCFLRGMTQKVNDDKLWLAIKESQNAIVAADASTIDLYTNSTHGGPTAVRFKAHDVGTWAPIVVWCKRKRANGWKRLGRYTFGPIRAETHHVLKRGRPYVTDIARLGKRVGD